jgi:hypothetical protein
MAAARSGRLCVALLALITSAESIEAQGRPESASVPAAPAGEQRLVSGRIVRPMSRSLAPVPGIWVTLHRVGPDHSGPLDSLRSGRDGGYTFRYRTSGSLDAVYFVSASYDGIAYFSAPLRAARVTGDDAEIVVYDTTSGPVPLHVRGRHIVISSPRVDGTREVVEVYELANDSSVTLISPSDSQPTWSAILPARAEDFEVGQGDISPRSVHAEAGRVTTVAPFAPGLKQLSFAYQLPARAFPLSIPLEHDVDVLEVLVEEPSARAEGAGLAQVAPVAIEGRTFHRYLAHDARRNAVFAISAPKVGAPPIDRRYVVGLALGIAAVMAGALALVFSRRRRAVPAPASAPAGAPQVDDESARLARAIAALDAEFERRANPTEEERAEYRARRQELKQRLARELDARKVRA